MRTIFRARSGKPLQFLAIVAALWLATRVILSWSELSAEQTTESTILFAAPDVDALGAIETADDPAGDAAIEPLASTGKAERNSIAPDEIDLSL